MDKTQIDGDRIFVIRQFLTPAECSAFVALSEQTGFEEATITIGGGFFMNKDIRDNARVIVDDKALARDWSQRAGALLPDVLSESRLLGLNERFRFYRYDAGQKFAPHYDGAFQRNKRERSRLTFMVYLNADFTGGETKFYGDSRDVRVTVRPETGMALVFAHAQLHEGAAVDSGRKYVLRTDVMYTDPEDRAHARPRH